MAIRLVFLGRLEDAAGAPERAAEAVPTLDALLDALEPDLAEVLRGDKVRIAVNGALVHSRESPMLSDGDEVAFLPPVSGG